MRNGACEGLLLDIFTLRFFRRPAKTTSWLAGEQQNKTCKKEGVGSAV